MLATVYRIFVRKYSIDEYLPASLIFVITIFIYLFTSGYVNLLKTRGNISFQALKQNEFVDSLIDNVYEILKIIKQYLCSRKIVSHTKFV